MKSLIAYLLVLSQLILVNASGQGKKPATNIMPDAVPIRYHLGCVTNTSEMLDFVLNLKSDGHYCMAQISIAPKSIDNYSIPISYIKPDWIKLDFYSYNPLGNPHGKPFYTSLVNKSGVVGHPFFDEFSPNFLGPLSGAIQQKVTGEKNGVNYKYSSLNKSYCYKGLLPQTQEAFINIQFPSDIAAKKYDVYVTLYYRVVKNRGPEEACFKIERLAHKKLILLNGKLDKRTEN